MNMKKIGFISSFLLLINVLFCKAEIKIGDIYYYIHTEHGFAEVGSHDKNDPYPEKVVIPPQVTYKGEIYKVLDIYYNAFNNCKEVKEVILPETIGSIYDYAFAGSGIKSIFIPKSVWMFGEGAISNCQDLASIEVDKNNLEYAAENGFLYSKIEVPYYDEKTVIAFTGAFKGDLVIPDYIREIGGYVFKNYEGIQSVQIPDSVYNIGEQAFRGCRNLKTVKMPTLLKRIGDYAFYECSSLTEIVIPKDVKKIGNMAFEGCTSLKKVTIEHHKELEIGINPFSECPNLETIICDVEVPPHNLWPSFNFSDNVYETAKLYVPKNSISLYKQHNHWRYFKNILPIETDGVEGIVDDEITSYTVYTTDGRLLLNDGRKEDLDGLKKGLYIINGKKVIR